MDATLHALGGILLKALPTFFLVILLHFYLKHMFFKPLERVLHERYEATEGARKRADESMETATAKAREYEAAMRTARGEIYQAQDELHQEMQQEREAGILQARESTDRLIKEAQAQLAADVAGAKAELAQQSDALAEQIAGNLLGGGRAA